MSEPLEQVLRRTGFRASLAPEYLDGHAPAAQRSDGHLRPEQPTYYGLPAIKKPTWTWHIPTYFFVGGLGSGTYIVAVLADMLGRTRYRALARAGALLSLLALAVSPVLLILDLGRPERWYHMLRVFRPRSVMNAGAWALTAMGACSGAAVIVQSLDALAERSSAARLMVLPMRAIAWAGLVPATFVGFYTGLLVAATNVPLWAANRLLMGPLFFSAALSTGLAAGKLAAPLFGSLSDDARKRITLAEDLVLAAELGLTVATRLQLGALAKPLTSGPIGWLYQLGSIGAGVVAPLALHRAGTPAVLRDVVAPALTLAGSLAMRVAFVKAGLRSADDPHAYFHYTRPR